MADIVDQHLKEWRKERPDLETTGIAVVNRIILLGKQFNKGLKEALKPLRLQTWEFDVLSTLRRQGDDYSLPPTILAKQSMLTTGAMTNRVDRLEERGLVERQPDPEDRRALYVALTDRGMDLIDRAVEIRSKEANRIVSSLEESEKIELGHLLRKVVTTI